MRMVIGHLSRNYTGVGSFTDFDCEGAASGDQKQTLDLFAPRGGEVAGFESSLRW
jgi:hypothetical protein